MPTEGSSDGVRSIWYDDISITWTRPMRGGSSERIAVPILPPICTSWPASRIRCATSAVVVDLPLVPVIATNGAFGAVRLRSTTKQFDVADHRNAGPLRREHGPVRRRMRQRHTRRQHQCGEVGPGDIAQIGGGEAGLRRLGEALRIVVAGNDVGAAGLQRMTARKPRPAEAEHRNRLALETGDGDHWVTAASASTARRAPA